MPMVKGTIKVLIQQFFMTLADQLRTTSRIHSEVPESTVEMAAVEDAHNIADIITNTAGRPALLHIVVRQLRLGNGDPLLEEQWVKRLRHMSMVTVLLLLVWVGTRLPGRLFAHE
jgi:uncharacterized protein